MIMEVKKFKKVLVANRGEIAIRVFRALSELGIGSVAVYSKEDRYALFRTKADEAYPLNPDKGPVDAYLDIPKIIRIAKEKKVDAIHPGYGFLSENPEFAEACRKNDIAFIGPNVEAMNIMGDKISAKRAAEESKVPIIDGSDFIIHDVDTAMKIADEIGYPVMLKASNGGGGRGMRIVQSQEEMEEAFEKSRNESKRVFGEAKLFIEKYLIHPKHIEVQILGDNYGNIVQLGTAPAVTAPHLGKALPVVQMETRRSLSLHQHGRFRKRRERRFWIRQKDLPEESDIRMRERWNFW